MRAAGPIIRCIGRRRVRPAKRPRLSTTRYRIAATDPFAHRFDVDCTIDDPDPDGQRVTLPAWIPGSYLIREFARHVVSVRASAQGRPVPIVKSAKDAWRVAPCAGPLTVTIGVYAHDVSVRTAYLDATRGYFNGTSVFLLPEGRAGAPCHVEIEPPAHGAIAPATLDVVLLPLSAFDAAGTRLGAGAGYYDRLLAFRHGRQGAPLLVGLAFDCQRSEAIPAEAHDVPLDAVITERGLVDFRANGRGRPRR